MAVVPYSLRILVVSAKCFWDRSYPCLSMHMCCILHVLANVGQVVKNLFPESISLSIVVQGAWWSTTVNGEDDRD